MFYWLLSILLYWTPAPYLGTLTLVFGAGYELVSSGRIHVSRKYLIVLALAVMSYVWGVEGNRFEPTEKTLITLAHFALLALLLDLGRIRFDSSQLTRFVSIFVTLGVVLSLSSYTSLAPFLYFEDAHGALRYKFVFSEPSYLGIFAAFLFFLIVNYGREIGRVEYLQLGALLVLMLLSLSGSALMLVGLAMAIQLWSKPISRASVRSLVFFLVIGGVALVVLYNYEFGGFLFNRITNLLEGGDDKSAEIRFLASYYLLLDSLENRLWLGTGLGFHAEQILSHYSSYSYMLKLSFEGDDLYNTNIDNAWVFVLFNFGLIGFFLLLALFAYCAREARGWRGVYLFLAVAMFFSGAFIHPLSLGGFFLSFGKTPNRNRWCL